MGEMSLHSAADGVVFVVYCLLQMHGCIKEGVQEKKDGTGFLRYELLPYMGPHRMRKGLSEAQLWSVVWAI